MSSCAHACPAPDPDKAQGYVFRIGGGNDKQGFPMKQGVLSNNRVRHRNSEGSFSAASGEVGNWNRSSKPVGFRSPEGFCNSL